MSSNKSICFTKALQVFLKCMLGWESCFSWQQTDLKQSIFLITSKITAEKGSCRTMWEASSPPSPSRGSPAAGASWFGERAGALSRRRVKHSAFQLYHCAVKAGQAVKRENKSLGQPLFWRTLVQKVRVGSKISGAPWLLASATSQTCHFSAISISLAEAQALLCF